MLAVQTLLTVTILVLFFVKFRIGLCVYIAYIFLVPYCSINIGGLSLGWNLMNTALLLAYCINCNRKFGKIQFSLHIPADTRSAFPVISVQSPVSIQCCWQS